MVTNTKALLEKLVRINSVTPHETEIAYFCTDYLKQTGFKTEIQRINFDTETARFNVLAEKGEGSNSILFFGHLDTVPPAKEYAEFGINPFELRYDKESNVFRGLGCSDMKAGIACTLNAFNNFTPKNCKVKIALLIDEENDSLGAFKLATQKREFFDDVKLAISTDLGGTDFEHRTTAPAVSCYHGNYGRFPLKILISTASKHGSIAGKNQATLEAARLLVLLSNNQEEFLERTSNFDQPGFSIRSIKTQATGFSVPDNVEMFIDFTTSPKDTTQKSVDKLQYFILEWINSQQLLLEPQNFIIETPNRGVPYFNAFEADLTNQYIQQAISSYENFFEIKFHKKINHSVADSNVFAQFFPHLPIITLGPTGGKPHSFDEWLHKDALDKAEKFYLYLSENFENRV